MFQILLTTFANMFNKLENGYFLVNLIFQQMIDQSNFKNYGKDVSFYQNELCNYFFHQNFFSSQKNH